MEQSGSVCVLEGGVTSLVERDSPLWRAGFYFCTELDRLQRVNRDTMRRRRKEIDKLLIESGLKLVGQATVGYSKQSEHGYTYQTCLLQSGAMIHTYPEDTFATAMFETCGPLLEVVERAVDELRWYYGARKVIFIEAPPLPFPSSRHAEEPAVVEAPHPVLARRQYSRG